MDGQWKREMGPCITRPYHLAADEWNHLIVSDSAECKLVVLNEHGQVITKFALESPPYSSCVDSEGKYWIATRGSLNIYTW